MYGLGTIITFVLFSPQKKIMAWLKKLYMYTSIIGGGCVEKIMHCLLQIIWAKDKLGPDLDTHSLHTTHALCALLCFCHQPCNTTLTLALLSMPRVLIVHRDLLTVSGLETNRYIPHTHPYSFPILWVSFTILH